MSEADALHQAYASWQLDADWRRQFPQMTTPVRRSEFTAVGKHARALLKEMEGVLAHDLPRARLLVRMQEAEGCQHRQSHYLGLLVLMRATLLAVIPAAEAEVSGPGGAVDPIAFRWIWMASVEWKRCTEKQPSAAEAGPFFRALADFKLAHPDLPEVTARTLRTALKTLRTKN